MRKIISLLLSVVLAFSLSINVFAVEGGGKPQRKTKIFKGDEQSQPFNGEELSVKILEKSYIFNTVGGHWESVEDIPELSLQGNETAAVIVAAGEKSYNAKLKLHSNGNNNNNGTDNYEFASVATEVGGEQTKETVPFNVYHFYGENAVPQRDETAPAEINILDAFGDADARTFITEKTGYIYSNFDILKLKNGSDKMEIVQLDADGSYDISQAVEVRVHIAYDVVKEPAPKKTITVVHNYGIEDTVSLEPIDYTEEFVPIPVLEHNEKTYAVKSLTSTINAGNVVYTFMYYEVISITKKYVTVVHNYGTAGTVSLEPIDYTEEFVPVPVLEHKGKTYTINILIPSIDNDGNFVFTFMYDEVVSIPKKTITVIHNYGVEQALIDEPIDFVEGFEAVPKGIYKGEAYVVSEISSTFDENGNQTIQILYRKYFVENVKLVSVVHVYGEDSVVEQAVEYNDDFIARPVLSYKGQSYTVLSTDKYAGADGHIRIVIKYSLSTSGGQDDSDNEDDDENLPDIDIPEPEIPLAPEPDIEDIVPPGSGTEETPQVPEEDVEIEEEDVPLGDLPKTGGVSGSGFLIAGIAAIGGGYRLRKKEQDK